MFTKIITTSITAILLVAYIATPANAWGSPTAVKKPKAIALSPTVVSAVRTIATSHDSAWAADIDQLVAHVARNADLLSATLSAASGGPPSHEAAMLTAVSEAWDTSCPAETDKMLAKNNKHKDKDKTKNNSINNTYGRANCAIAFDECNTACTGGPEVGLFGRFRTPEPGTCALVCTVVREGCTRCNNKRKLHAAHMGGSMSGMIAKMQILSLELGENVFNMIVRGPRRLWTLASNHALQVAHCFGPLLRLLRLFWTGLKFLWFLVREVAPTILALGLLWIVREAKRIVDELARRLQDLMDQLDRALAGNGDSRVVNMVRRVILSNEAAQHFWAAITVAQLVRQRARQAGGRRGQVPDGGNSRAEIVRGGGHGGGGAISGGGSGGDGGGCGNDGGGGTSGGGSGGEGGNGNSGGSGTSGGHDGGDGGGGNCGGDGGGGSGLRGEWGVHMVIGYVTDRLPRFW